MSVGIGGDDGAFQDYEDDFEDEAAVAAYADEVSRAVEELGVPIPPNEPVDHGFPTFVDPGADDPEVGDS